MICIWNFCDGSGDDNDDDGGDNDSDIWQMMMGGKHSTWEVTHTNFDIHWTRMTIRWRCTKVLKANSQSAAIDKCHVCLGVTSAEKGSLQKWPVYGDIWGRFLPWPISCLANATTNTMQKVSAIAQPLQHYKHHVVMVTNMEYGKVVCKSRKRNIS